MSKKRVSGTRPTKPPRRTRKQVAGICDAIRQLLDLYRPMTVRQVFYRLVSKATGAKGIGKSAVPKENRTLEEIGITKKESSTAQALANISRTAPDLHREVREGETSIQQARQRMKVQRQKETHSQPVAEPESVIAEGDLFRIERADCLSFLAGLPEDSIDLVFGSPPYEDARLYLENGKDEGIARGPEAWVAWMIEVYRAALRCCRGLVAFVVEGRTTNYRWSASPALLMADLHRAGITLRKPPIYRRVAIPVDELRALAERCITQHIDQRALDCLRLAEATERRQFTELCRYVNRQQEIEDDDDDNDEI